MITEAIVIGAVDAAVFLDDGLLHAVRLGSTGEELIDCSRDVGWLLSTGAEKRRLPRPPRDIAELGAQLREWAQRHRALTMTSSGMDARLTEPTRTTCILAAEENLRSPFVAAFARARLLGCPPSEEADLDGALRLCFEANARRAATLYGDLSDAMPYIATVRQLLEKLLRYEFDEALDPENALRAMVDSGLVADAIEATIRRDGVSLSGLVFRGADESEVSRALPRTAHFLARFVAAVRREFDAWPEHASIAATKEMDHAHPRADGHLFLDAVREWKDQLAFQSRRKRQESRPSLSPDEVQKRVERVNSQKKFIIENLEGNRLARADNSIVALIRSQQHYSTLAQLCMSLCDLGAYATRRGLFELAERLYRAAAFANDEDPVPATGYAETLRQMGRPEDALAAYTEAKAAFPHEPVPATGYAETLRQMGRVEEAKSALRHILMRFPHDRVVKNALACLLVEMQNLTEARSLIEVAAPRTEQDWRDYHVIAMSFLTENKYSEAAQRLRLGIETAPFPAVSQVFRNGLAVMELNQRHYKEAIDLIVAASDNVIRFQSPATAVLEAHARAALGEIDRAQEVLDRAEQARQPAVVSLSDFLRRRYRLGAYEKRALAEAEADQLDRAIAEQELALALRVAA